jgi:hypothetical protein
MERKSELHLERQWELYRRSVAEGMPDSDYKAAVVAGIEHALSRLDSLEACQCAFTDRPGKLRTQ